MIWNIVQYLYRTFSGIYLSRMVSFHINLFVDPRLVPISDRLLLHPQKRQVLRREIDIVEAQLAGTLRWLRHAATSLRVWDIGNPQKKTRDRARAGWNRSIQIHGAAYPELEDWCVPTDEGVIESSTVSFKIKLESGEKAASGFNWYQHQDTPKLRRDMSHHVDITKQNC